MNYATNIALIDKETNLVTNVIWGMIYQLEEFNNDEQLAVAINDLSISLGDSYDGKNFYHQGEKVLSISDQLAEALKENARLKAALGTEI